MRVIAGSAQDIGDRESQEDAFDVSSSADRTFGRHGGAMMVLCDGMGGLANGAIASRVAVTAARDAYSHKRPSEEIPSALDRIIREAHQAVCARLGEDGASGTTIVVAVVWEDRLYWASVGDSRLYLCREGAPAAQLTADHNVRSLLDEGVGGESFVPGAVSTANPEALTKYLGAPYPPQPHIDMVAPLRPGDRIVACSDGLYRGLSPEEIADIARRGDPMTAAEHLKHAVLRKRLPHQDNLTVVLFEVSPRGSLIETTGGRLIKLIGVARPTVREAAYGAVGMMLGILITLGALALSSPGRHSTTVTATPQTSAAPPSPRPLVPPT
jgi:protein phosphatase